MTSSVLHHKIRLVMSTGECCTWTWLCWYPASVLAASPAMNLPMKSLVFSHVTSILQWQGEDRIHVKFIMQNCIRGNISALYVLIAFKFYIDPLTNRIREISHVIITHQWRDELKGRRHLVWVTRCSANEPFVHRECHQGPSLTVHSWRHEARLRMRISHLHTIIISLEGKFMQKH